MMSLLGRSAFRKLWLAGALSQLGSEISRIALLLHLFGEQGDVVVLAGYLLCRTVPGMLLSPIAGVAIDRCRKRRVMILADISCMVIVVGVMLVPSVPVIYVGSFMLAIGSTFFEPAKYSAIPDLIPSEELNRANALERSTASAILVLGPIAGALLFVNAGLNTTLVIDALTFAASAALVFHIRSLHRAGGVCPKPLRAQVLALLQGFHFIAGSGLLRYLLGFTFVGVLCVGVWVPLAPFFITSFLGEPESFLGLAIACFGAGSAVGGLVNPYFAERLGNGRLILAAFLIESISLIAYALTPIAWLSLLILFFWGAVVSMLLVSEHTVIQLQLPGRYLGRVFAAIRQAEDAAMVCSLLLVITLNDAFRANEVFLAMGAIYLVALMACSNSKGARALVLPLRGEPHEPLRLRTTQDLR